MTYSKIVLWLFCLSYLALGLWCLLAPETVSARLGFGLVGDTGLSEFSVVYGGLELAIGIFFGLCASRGQLRLAGLYFAVISSCMLFIVRAFTVFVLPEPSPVTYRLLGAELVISILAVSALWTFRRSEQTV